MQESPFFARSERFASVGSTNDVVRSWLDAGIPEVCLAIADEQTAGRGRNGRSWQAPAGAALLCSLGFRPTWLPADRSWRLASIVALAMADAAEEVAGLKDGAIRLKWPNDLVVEDDRREGIAGSGGDTIRKLAGVLGETVGLGTDDPRVVVGIGVNADWPAERFPVELAATMTSLREASGGRPIDPVALVDAFTGRLEARTEALRNGRFGLADWIDRQLTTGRRVQLDGANGTATTEWVLGVDAATGGLIVADPGDPAGERIVLAGEVSQVRLSDASTDDLDPVASALV